VQIRRRLRAESDPEFAARLAVYSAEQQLKATSDETFAARLAAYAEVETFKGMNYDE